MDTVVFFLFILPQMHEKCNSYSKFVRNSSEKYRSAWKTIQSGTVIISF